ncbi:MAG: molybdopterin-dependent oxidoreductase [Proteobacteria bacterium]|nr:molybdopterin-dependent oxidoreductase [Pseudomonadota bacterium]MCP4920437.1 molybdopterin-dependent oxidoreductase [Pseudomonadota bacterium]
MKLTLNGRQVEARDGETLLDVTRREGLNVPTLCAEDRVDPMGSCRMCLVEVEGQRRLQPSCAWKAEEGQVVETESDRVKKHRQLLLSMYLADHELDDDDLPRERGTGNKLRQHVLDHGTGPKLPAVEAPRLYRDDANPYVHFEPEACVLCNLCVRYCDEVEAVSAITLAGRGAATTIATVEDKGLLDTTCELCGGCIDVCPTGAMTEKASLLSDFRTETAVRSTCNFCGVGCQLNLHVRDDKVVRVTSPEPGTTVNDGNLCVKGRFATEFINHEDRLTTPLIRGADGQLHEATWDEALDAVAKGLNGIRDRHGSDALGFISSSRCTGEENYLVQKLSRAAFGTNNCHQCAAT